MVRVVISSRVQVARFQDLSTNPLYLEVSLSYNNRITIFLLGNLLHVVLIPD